MKREVDGGMKLWAILTGRRTAPFVIFGLSALIYVAFLGPRASESTEAHMYGSHYVHLANSFLHGQLGVVENRALGIDDEALYNGRWYISFPPFPAIVILPAVAIFGLQTKAALFWALFAGVSPALVWLLLRALREAGRSQRSAKEDLLLTVLFAFGSAYFYTSVQGTVWFAAQIVACTLMALFALFSLDAKRPVWAGSMLALSFMTRPTTLFAGLFFLVESLRVSIDGFQRGDADAPWWRTLVHWLRHVRFTRVAKKAALFSIPLAVIGGLAMWMNNARFDSPLEFGHTYLQVQWQGRIQTWGLFSYHFLARNLSVFLGGLPWLTHEPPHLRVSEMGLAFWVTTPNLALVLWPRRVDATMVGLYLASFAIALLNLLYQSTGYEQFAYRYILDYIVLLIALLALGGRRFSLGFFALCVWSVCVNAFGAATFYRAWQFYERAHQLFQPD